jgi:hypothetical protein
MGQRQIFDPAQPLQIRDLNEMFRELFESAYASRRDAAGCLRLDGSNIMLGILRVRNQGNQNAIVQTSSVAGEAVFGVAPADGAAVQAYMRVGPNRYMYNDGSAEYNVLHAGNVRKLLWSGSWSGGNLTVPGFQNYRLYEVGFAGTDMRALAFRSTTYFLGIGGVNTGGGNDTVTFGATYSGNTLTFLGALRLSHVPGGNHRAGTTYAVSAVYGLL